MMAMAMMAVLMCANFASCSNEEALVEPQGDEYVTVKLGYAGELLDITTSPMSRAENNDLYLVNIKEVVTRTDDYDYTYTDEYEYAYGIFDNVEDMSVNLLKNGKYKFYVSVIIDGKDNYYLGYEHSCDNSFTYASNVDDYYYELSVDDIYNDQYEFDRFYGEKEFTAEEGNNEVTIEPIRVAYKIVGKSSGLTDAGGSLTLSFSSDSYYYEYFTMELTSDDKPQEVTRTMSRMEYVYNYYMDGYNDYQTVDASLSIVWTKADGTEKNMGSHNVKFERGKATTITVTPQDLDHPVTLSISLDGNEWGTGEVYDF